MYTLIFHNVCSWKSIGQHVYEPCVCICIYILKNLVNISFKPAEALFVVPVDLQFI